MPAFFYDMLNVAVGNNTLFVSLNERIRLDTPFILLQLTYTQSTPDVKVMLVIDGAAAGKKYNELALEVVSTSGAEDLANGKVFLRPGDYHYEIFERVDGTLDTDGQNRLERGILKFDVDTNTEEEYDEAPTEKIYVP